MNKECDFCGCEDEHECCECLEYISEKTCVKNEGLCYSCLKELVDPY